MTKVLSVIEKHSYGVRWTEITFVDGRILQIYKDYYTPTKMVDRLRAWTGKEWIVLSLTLTRQDKVRIHFDEIKGLSAASVSKRMKALLLKEFDVKSEFDEFANIQSVGGVRRIRKVFQTPAQKELKGLLK